MSPARLAGVSKGALMANFRSGLWSTLGEARTTAELARVGFDWIGLDAQHGHFDDRALRDSLARRRSDGPQFLVRVLANDAGLIGRALDAGADGVIVPMVESAEQARAAAASVFYPPEGRRSWGPFQGSGAEGANDSAPLCAVMIETRAGLDDASAICGVSGVGMVFVGPFDLSIALGTTVDALLADRAPHAPLPTIVRACKEAGIVAGAYAGDPDRARMLRECGFEWVAVCTEAGLLRLGAERALEAVRSR